jgi:hypothetical protein
VKVITILLRVKQVIEEVFTDAEKIIYANQNEGFDWMYLS